MELRRFVSSLKATFVLEEPAFNLTFTFKWHGDDCENRARRSENQFRFEKIKSCDVKEFVFTFFAHPDNRFSSLWSRNTIAFQDRAFMRVHPKWPVLWILLNIKANFWGALMDVISFGHQMCPIMFPFIKHSWRNQWVINRNLASLLSMTAFEIHSWAKLKSYFDINKLESLLILLTL